MSRIDVDIPTAGHATTESVRTNFRHARDEIEALAALIDGLGDLAQLSAPLPVAAGGTGATTATAALAALGAAPLASPALTGTPTGPTATAGTSTPQLATTAFVGAAVAAAGLPLPLAVGSGGTGLAQGTAGGLLYFSGAAALASSPALGLGLVLTGGGPGNPPAAAPNWSFPNASELRGNQAAGALGTSGLAPVLRLAGPDNGFPGVLLEGWGTGHGFVIGRGSGGTGAAPAPTTAGMALLSLSGRGYDTAYSVADSARIRLTAGETFSATARGAYISFSTTAAATTTLVETMRLFANGGLGLPGSVAGAGIGQGTINVSGGYYLAGAPALRLSGSTVQLAGATMLGPLTLAADPTLDLHAATKAYVDAHAGSGGGGAYLPLAGGTVTGALGVNLNTVALPAGGVQGITILGPDNPTGSVPGLAILRYGGTAGLQLRMFAAGGTAAAPTAVATGTIFGDWFTLGYNGSSFQRATILRCVAAEAWTATANGAAIQINTTAIGTNALRTSMFHANGSLLMPSTLGDTGNGTINVSGGYFINGVNIRTGTTAADAAPAGQIGEYQEASRAIGAALGLTNAIAVNVTSLSLGPGDWQVWGHVVFQVGSGGADILGLYISTQSATPPQLIERSGQFDLAVPFMAGTGPRFPTGVVRLSFATTTTVYLVATASFASGAVSAAGTICARRMR